MCFVFFPPLSTQIPSSAVEMPGSADVSGLNVQFGALDFGSEAGSGVVDMAQKEPTREQAPPSAPAPMPVPTAVPTQQPQSSLFSKPGAMRWVVICVGFCFQVVWLSPCPTLLTQLKTPLMCVDMFNVYFYFSPPRKQWTPEQLTHLTSSCIRSRLPFTIPGITQCHTLPLPRSSQCCNSTLYYSRDSS